MKIVLDTNVLIAALIARGVCHDLLEHCVLRHTLLTSDFILNETREKLVEKFEYSANSADEVVSLLRSRMILVASGLATLRTHCPLPTAHRPHVRLFTVC